MDKYKKIIFIFYLMSELPNGTSDVCDHLAAQVYEQVTQMEPNICRLTPFCLPFTLEGNEIFLSRFVITFLFQMKIETSKCEGFIS